MFHSCYRWRRRGGQTNEGDIGNEGLDKHWGVELRLEGRPLDPERVSCPNGRNKGRSIFDNLQRCTQIGGGIGWEKKEFDVNTERRSGNQTGWRKENIERAHAGKVGGQSPIGCAPSGVRIKRRKTDTGRSLYGGKNIEKILGFCKKPSSQKRQ